MQQIRQFAHKHNLTVVTKRTNYSREYKKEAEQFILPQPFIAIGNAAIGFVGVTSNDLQEMLN